ncbi:anoctamin-5-like [Choristoneura fumiferana]|uniref:anoctamin-5-like n=1 Tax=Choristoneura fumiferana TaxID=7141 RepID=UPI003D1553AC
MTEELGISTEPEAKDEVPFGRTGFFRDGTRRIDLVLVVKDDGNSKREAIIIDFLTNVLKFGLCLELEPGLMVFHRNLVFIKVHAPESIIEEYGRKFEVRRYFKQNHIEFANPKGLIQRLLSYIDYTGSYEREWVKLVRRKYPHPKRYSTIERSTIVHKLLLNLPFGDHENYVGYNRLLQGRIILDAFPLHDGPYFAVPGQFPAEYNARQILNYNWAGWGNLLKLQPLNLIHEYFGDRLAFLFAFYGFYTVSLIIPAIISTDAILLDLRIFLNDSAKNYYAYNIYPKPMCPTCIHLEGCRFIPQEYFRIAENIARIFDQEDINVIMVYIVIWATLFVLFWRRKEYYWSWMWECKPEIPARTVRYLTLI